VVKKTNVACFHNHTVNVSTLSHAGHVEKNSVATPRQAQKNKQNTKQQMKHNQSCGSHKTFFST
jgi:hypothetical protein